MEVVKSQFGKGGMMDRIIRVDLANQKIIEEMAPKELNPLGGRALIDRILSMEVDPSIHPLSRENKLIFAPGLFAGTSVPNSGRLSVGAKSPLTSGIKEANSGGTLATRLARLGIKALILEGRSKSGAQMIVVKKDSISIVSAEDYAGFGNYEASRRIREQFGNHVALASIGPCGEMMMSAATIAISDTNGFPSRHCARGGLGAVMGSKHIKAIVVDDKGGSSQRPLNRDSFRAAVKEATEIIKNNPRTSFFRSKGTPGLIPIDNARGSLPTRNYRLGSFDRFQGLGAERMVELIKERGGKMGHACMPGCIVRCSTIFHDKEKAYLTSALEYETLAMLGSNLEIDDMDTVASMDRKCDDYGLDTIEIGATLGVLGETDYFDFGDKNKALALIDEIGSGTLLGRIMGQGVYVTCRVFGIDRVPAVKGQALPAHSARSMKGLGVTYATSPQGADHTAGFVAEDPLSPEGQVERSLQAQINMLLMDSLGLCYFCFLMGNIGLFTRLINALLGLNMREADVLNISKKALREEIDFNVKAGIPVNNFSLPKFLESEPLFPTNEVFDVPKDEIRRIFDSIL